MVRFSSRGDATTVLKLKTIATTDHGDDAFFKASLAVRSEVESDPSDRGHEMRFSVTLRCT